MSENLERVHERMDDIQKDIVAVKVSLATIEAKLPTQPCQTMKDHLQQHEKAERNFWRVISPWLSPAAIGAAAVAIWKSWGDN